MDEAYKGYRYTPFKKGSTAAHHGRYGEGDFALLLASQKGTAIGSARHDSKARDTSHYGAPFVFLSPPP